LLDARARTQHLAGQLPLTPGADLRWLGLTETYAPVAVDTAGVVRCLLGTGPGSWGPSGGSSGEWVPVMSMQEEEVEARGPLWIVHAKSGALMCAEVGESCQEPKPPAPEPEPAVLLAEAQLPHDIQMPERVFGHGTALREVAWRLPIGSVAVAGAAAEEAMRRHLLANYASRMAEAGILLKEGAVDAGAKKMSFQLFGVLAKAGEVERALDIARHSLATGAAGAKLLDMARQFAERAGHRRLADEVAALPRLSDTSAPLTATPATAHGTAPPASSPAKTLRRELPPLFEPGELSNSNVENSPQKAQQASVERLKATMKPVATLATEVSPTRKKNHSNPTPFNNSMATATSQETSTTVTTSLSQSALPSAAAIPRDVAAPSVPNPFARQRPASSKLQQVPHLLRDALGAGNGMRRMPTSAGAAGEPATKMAKVGA